MYLIRILTFFVGDGDGYILECIHNERRKVDLFSLREEVSESDVLTIVQGSFPDCVVMHISDKYFLSFGGTHPTFNLPSTFRVFDEEMNGKSMVFFFL